MPIIRMCGVEPESEMTAACLEEIAGGFCDRFRLNPKQLTLVWNPLQPTQMVVNGRACSNAEQGEPPILVDLLLPDCNEQTTIELMLAVLADLIAEGMQVSVTQVSINCQLTQSDMVYDNGSVVRW